MTPQRIGFIGLGVMGMPMALNLARSGQRLVVWNRSLAKCQALRDYGADIVGTPPDVFAATRTVVLMLANSTAIDEVLDRGGESFAVRVRDRTVVQMGTTSPEYSAKLATDIAVAGGRYVECPVSGSRKPAEAGDLVGMLAGEPAVVSEVRPMLAPMCRETFVCGPVPAALLMKLSVNLFLITMVTGLCEAFHFADTHGLDTRLFEAILDAGPMASKVSRVKLPKLVEQEFSVQASIADVHMNSLLVAQAARRAKVAGPLLDAACELFQETMDLGYTTLDMVGVVKAIEARSRLARPAA